MNAVHDHILARLNLNAVFPALAALVRLDEDSRSLIAGRHFGIELKTRSGLSSRLDFLGGDVEVNSRRPPQRVLRLFFLSDRQLNNSFSGSGLSIPIPIRGFVQLTRVRALSTLATRLRRVLSASPSQLLGEDLVTIHTDLLVSELIPSAVTQLSRFDEFSRMALCPFRDRVARLEIDGGVSSEIRVPGENGENGAGICMERPDVIISFRSRSIALAALHGELDNLAAIGKGDVRIHGLIPFADALGTVLNRLSRLMNDSR